MDINNILSSVRGPFTRIELVKMNLNSHSQVKKYLLSQGWEPTQWNFNKETKERTSPKLTEDSFESIKGGLGQLIARRNILRHRRNMLLNFSDEDKGLLNLIRDDGTIPSEAITCGTPTSRYTHRVIVNIPSPPAILGKEMRQCFTVAEPYRFLGADLKAIESRLLAHFTFKYDGGKYASEILDGDIHTKNAEMLGCDRSTAKTFLYAVLFGAGKGKLASILGVSTAKAEVLISNFWSGNEGLDGLVKAIKKFHKRYGYLVGLDGRKMFIRSEHILLNSLCQGNAAIVFKRWMVLVNEKLRGMDIHQIIAMHDELQFKCHCSIVDHSIKVIEETAKEAGEFYNLKVPILTDCSVGMNWYDTH